MREESKVSELSKSSTKRNNKSIYIVIGIIVCVIAVVLLYRRLSVPQSIKEYFFNDSKLLKEEDILKVKGEVIKVDDYVFQLKESLVERKVICGYLMIEINKKNGKVVTEKEIEDRFNFTMRITGTMNKKFVNVGDRLYLFIDFAADKEFDYTLEVIDYTIEDDKTESGCKTYLLNVPKTSDAQTFEIDEKTKIFLSSLGISIESNKEIKKICVDVYYKDGRKENLYNVKENKSEDYMDGFGGASTTNGDSPEDDYYWYYDTFDEVLNISEVDYIVFNGEKLLAK